MLWQSTERQLDDLLQAFPRAGAFEGNSIFSAILSEVGSFIYQVAFSILRDAEESRDIEQQVRVKLVGELKAGNIESRPALFGFLKKVTRNVCLDFLRSNTRRRRREEAVGEDIIASSQENDSKHELLKIVLQKLSEDHRTVLEAYFKDEEAVKRYGESLGLSTPALQKRKSRALSEARKIFDEMERYARR